MAATATAVGNSYPRNIPVLSRKIGMDLECLDIGHGKYRLSIVYNGKRASTLADKKPDSHIGIARVVIQDHASRKSDLPKEVLGADLFDHIVSML